MPVVHVGEIDLWYADQHPKTASPLPVLLLHGAGGSHLDWPATLRRLPDRRVIALDLPGHGRSSPPWRDSIAVYAGELSRLLDRLDIPRCILVGHSMGGAIALALALQRPECAAGLILIASGARLPVPSEIVDGLIEEPRPALSRFGARLGMSGMSAVDPAVLRADLLACDRFDARPTLDRLTMPALVIAGRDDRMTPVSFSAELASRMGKATLVIVDGGGHFLVLEQPDQVGGIVRDWLAGVDPG